MAKYVFILLAVCTFNLCFAQQERSKAQDSAKTGFEIPESNLYIKLPGKEWKLAEKTQKPSPGYIFKREEIHGPNGNIIIPGIMIYTEDAKDFNGDIISYSISKRMAFADMGLKFDKILVQNSKDYPLTFKNAIFMKASYTIVGEDHLLYMIHIINSKNQGIQILMDMTKDIAEEYEHEFIEATKSLRELKQ
jgi:hypothetical protein